MISCEEVDFFSSRLLERLIFDGGSVFFGAGAEPPGAVPSNRRTIGLLGIDWVLVGTSFTMLS